MKKYIFKILNFLIFLSIGILLLYFAFKGINLKDLISELKVAKYSWVLLALFIALLAHLSRAYRWKILIETLGYRPSFLYCFYALMIGYMANYAFPRLGEITRCGSLKKTNKIPFDALIGTVIIERAIDLLILIILLFSIFFAKIELFGDFINENIFSPVFKKISYLFNVSILVWIFFLSGIILFIVIYFILKKKASNTKAIQSIKKIVKGIISGIKTVFQMEKRGAFIIHTLFIWAMYFFMTYLLFFSFQFTSGLTILDGLFIMIIGSLGFTAPVQGGIGVYHILVSLGLTLFGISREDGLVFATLSHGAQSLLVIMFGALAVFILFISNIKSSKINA